MTDATIRVQQATTDQRVVSLESRVKTLTEKLEKLSHDAVSKKAIVGWISGVGGLVAIAATVIHMMGE